MQRMLLTVLLLSLAATAAAQELKLATLAPDGSVWMEVLREAADDIHARTEQRVRIRYYPGGVMGDTRAVTRRMRLGQLQGGAFTFGDFVDQVPEVQAMGLPFLFRNEAEFTAVRDELMPRLVARFADQGLILIGTAGGGFAYLFTRQPVAQAGDLGSGFRVWVPENDVLSQRTLQRIGVNPVPLAMAEVYTGLQTGTVNAFASTTSGAIILQWHTRARYMLDYPLVMTVGAIVLDQRAFSRLAEGDQAIVRECLAGALSALEQRTIRDNQAARNALQEQGIALIPPQPDWAALWGQKALETREAMMAEGRIQLPWLDHVVDRLAALRAE